MLYSTELRGRSEKRDIASTAALPRGIGRLCRAFRVNEPGVLYYTILAYGAGRGIRTLDLNLGKIALYP
jgi:hypothetical protein